MFPFLSVGISLMFDGWAKQPLGLRFMKTQSPLSRAGHMISLTQRGESLTSEGRNVVRRLIVAQYETVNFAPLPRPDGCRQGGQSNKLDSQAALCCLFTTLQRWVLVCAMVSLRATVISVCQAERSRPSQKKSGQNTAGCENHQSR